MRAGALGEAMAECGVALGLSEGGEEIASEVEALLTGVMARFDAHPHWPSAASPDGVPFEFSLSIGAGGAPTLRYAVDLTDHATGLAGNWDRYLRCGAALTGASRGDIWDLVARHLDGIPAMYRTRMMHGAGFGLGGQRRSTLYFRAAWLSGAELRSRFPAPLAAADETCRAYGGTPICGLEAMSYDFSEGRAARVKLYQPLRPEGRARSLRDLAGSHPDLEAAGELFGVFLPPERGLGPQPLLLQLSPSGSLCRAKLVFMCAPWGWDTPRGLARVLDHLGATHSAPLACLDAVLGVFSRHRIGLRPTVLSVGSGHPSPAVSFYFAPAAADEPPARRPGAGAAAGRAAVETMLTGARRFLLDRRAADGLWGAFDLPGSDPAAPWPPGGPPGEWTSAFITAVLAGDPPASEHLWPGVHALEERFRPSQGWGPTAGSPSDAETTALAVLALRRMGVAAPPGAGAALRRYRLPGGGYGAQPGCDMDNEGGHGAAEITAVAILAAAGLGDGAGGDAAEDAAELIAGGVASLVASQREDGGWNAFWWLADLVATSRAVQALGAAVAEAGRPGTAVLPATAGAAARATQAAQVGLAGQAVGDDPTSGALWLRAWLDTSGSPNSPSIRRIVRCLSRSQEADGRWRSGPLRRIAQPLARRPWARPDSGRLLCDTSCLITTAIVMDGLLALRQALEPGGAAPWGGGGRGG